MAIYGRFGGVVEIVRRGTLDDVPKYDKRKVDDEDRANVHGYVIVRFDDGSERLYHLAYLRADGASLEITRALLAIDCKTTIAAAEADGVVIDDGNVVDLCADNIHASLSDIRQALVATGLGERFPNATKDGVA